MRPSQRATGGGNRPPRRGSWRSPSSSRRPRARARLLACWLIAECSRVSSLSEPQMPRLVPARRGEQLVPGAELHARAAQLLAGGALGRRSPASPRRRRRRRRARRAARRRSARRRRVRGSAGRGVLEQQLDRLRRVLLVRADHAGRAALDPARAVDAGTRAVLRRGRARSRIVPRPSSKAHPAARRRGSRRCGRRSAASISRSSVATARAAAAVGLEPVARRARSPRRDRRRGSRPARRGSGATSASAFPRARAPRTRAGPRGSAREFVSCSSAASLAGRARGRPGRRSRRRPRARRARSAPGS